MGSDTTRAPARRARSAVQSREPLSVTTISSSRRSPASLRKARNAVTTLPIAASSSRAGMTTPMDRPSNVTVRYGLERIRHAKADQLAQRGIAAVEHLAVVDGNDHSPHDIISQPAGEDLIVLLRFG